MHPHTSEIDHYRLTEWHIDGETSVAHLVRIASLDRAIRDAKKMTRAGAAKVEIFACRRDGSLFHRMPVRIYLGTNLRQTVLRFRNRY